MTLDGSDSFYAKINKSTGIIEKAAEKTSQPLVVNFSGGKDSYVLLDLVQQVTSNFICFYMVSGIDLKESLRHVEKVCQELDVRLLVSHPQDYATCWSVRKNGFFERLERFGYWPTVKVQWCSVYLKIRPARQVLRRLFGRQRICKLNGVRRKESSRRMQIYRRTAEQGYMRSDPEQPESVMVFPILEWTDNDVKGYIELRDIRQKQSPLYKRFGVSGCIYCPFYQPEIYKRIAKEDPGLYDTFIEYERKLGKPAVIGHLWLRDLVETADIERR